MAEEKISLPDRYLDLIVDETSFGRKVSWYYDKITESAALGSSDLDSERLKPVTQVKVSNNRFKITSKLPDGKFAELVEEETVCVYPDQLTEAEPVFYVIPEDKLMLVTGMYYEYEE